MRESWTLNNKKYQAMTCVYGIQHDDDFLDNSIFNWFNSWLVPSIYNLIILWIPDQTAITVFLYNSHHDLLWIPLSYQLSSQGSGSMGYVESCWALSCLTLTQYAWRYLYSYCSYNKTKSLSICLLLFLTAIFVSSKCTLPRCSQTKTLQYCAVRILIHVIQNTWLAEVDAWTLNPMASNIWL